MALWKVLFLFSSVVVIFSLISLAYLQVNISGDGVPNRPQGGPPIEYPWDQALVIFVTMILSMGAAVYTWRRIAVNTA